MNLPPPHPATAGGGSARERYCTLLWRLISSGQWERVLAAAGDWLAEDPEAADPHQAAGQALVNLHRHEPALAHLQRALAARPESGFVHRLTSIAYFQLGFFPRADFHAMEAIRLQPNDAMHWYHLALMGYEHRYFDVAAGYARRSLTLSPDNADTINLLALCERKDPGQRRVHYQRALAIDPGNAVVHNNLGVHHLNETRDHASAAECFRRALSVDPADANAQRNLVLAFRMGDPLHAFLRFPQRFFVILSFRQGAYSWRSAVWLGFCALTWGMPIFLLLALYGAWLTGGLPLLKAYEAVTLPDLRERAGVPGARRGGPWRFWRWPRWVRVMGLFAVYAACVYGLVQAGQRAEAFTVALAMLAVGAVVTAVRGTRVGWKAFRTWRTRRQMEKKFAQPPPVPVRRPGIS